MASYEVYKPTEKIKDIYGAGTLEPPKYMPSYYEWLFKQGGQIIEDRSLTNTTVDLYTVPADYTFFLCSIVMNGMNADGVNNRSVGLDIKNRLVLALLNVYPQSSDNMVVNYTVPMQIHQNEILTAGADASITNDITIYGFLVPNSVIPSF